jgi:hypothetical protein
MHCVKICGAHRVCMFPPCFKEKKGESQGKKMSRYNYDEQENLCTSMHSMCRLGRARRKEYEGRGEKRGGDENG